jgi:hypothetical protein
LDRKAWVNLRDKLCRTHLGKQMGTSTVKPYI